MTIERATEINAILIAHVMHRDGLRDDPPPSLRALPLNDMLEATRIIESQRPRTQMVCDVRLIAALYVVYNYEPSDFDCIDPIAISRDGRIVCVL